MRRPIFTAVAALLVCPAGAARAQSANDIPAILAVGVEQLGQGVGEAALGGASVFVTAKGTARIEGARPYAVSVQGVADTAAGAALVRDAKVERLRAVAKRFSAPLSIGEASYAFSGRGAPQPIFLPNPSVQPGPARPIPPAPPPQFTASVVIRFTRPPEASMPAFLDAVHEAGVDQLASTGGDAPNPFAAAAGLFGLGGVGPDLDQAIWDKAAAAAVAAARLQAEVLAVAGGRHVGEVRQILLLSKLVQGDQAVVTLAARFAFAP